MTYNSCMLTKAVNECRTLCFDFIFTRHSCYSTVHCFAWVDCHYLLVLSGTWKIDARTNTDTSFRCLYVSVLGRSNLIYDLWPKQRGALPVFDNEMESAAETVSCCRTILSDQTGHCVWSKITAYMDRTLWDLQMLNSSCSVLSLPCIVYIHRAKCYTYVVRLGFCAWKHKADCLFRYHASTSVRLVQLASSNFCRGPLLNSFGLLGNLIAYKILQQVVCSWQKKIGRKVK